VLGLFRGGGNLVGGFSLIFNSLGFFGNGNSVIGLLNISRALLLYSFKSSLGFGSRSHGLLIHYWRSLIVASCLVCVWGGRGLGRVKTAIRGHICFGVLGAILLLLLFLLLILLGLVLGYQI
jgi:hypothetical protein